MKPETKARMRAIVARMRVDKGTWNELIEAAWINYKEHGRESIPNAFTEAVMDHVLRRYHTKIANGFARVGIYIDPEVPLTADGLALIINERTGLTIDTLTPQSVTAAIDRELSLRMTELLGVPIDSVLNPYEFRSALEQAAINAIHDGRATEFISRKAMAAARRYSTYQRRGLESPEDRKRLANREAQRRYRKTHRQVWD